MKKFLTYAGALLTAAAMVLSCKTPESEKEREITQEGMGPDAGILRIATPGLYGVGGLNYRFGTDGWNQCSFITGADGSIRWRLINAATLSVLTLTGPKADTAQGEELTLHVVLNEKGTHTFIENYNARMLYEKEGTWWYKVDEETYFILKKEAAL